jgi:hypothetical protein
MSVHPRVLAVEFMSCGDTQISGWKKPREIANGNKLILQRIMRWLTLRHSASNPVIVIRLCINHPGPGYNAPCCTSCYRRTRKYDQGCVFEVVLLGRGRAYLFARCAAGKSSVS